MGFIAKEWPCPLVPNRIVEVGRLEEWYAVWAHPNATLQLMSMKAIPQTGLQMLIAMT